MTPQFAAFIAPANPRKQLWRVAVVMVFWFLLYMIFTAIILVGWAFAMGLENWFAMAQLALFNSPIEMMALFSTFIGWIAALWILLWLVHRRGLRSLFGPNLWGLTRHFLQAMLYFGVFAVVMQLLLWPGDEVQENIALDVLLKFLAPALVLLFIQITAEELLFRGYLLQQLAARFSSRWMFIVLPSMLFGLLHFDPSYGVLLALMVCAMTGFMGVILADVTYRTGNIGWAMGIHFVNDAIALFWISYQETLSGLALYTVPDVFEDSDKAIGLLLPQFGLLCIGYFIYFFIMERRQQRIELGD